MVVAVSEPIEQYRLALSYLEKVHREQAKWQRVVDAQPVKVTKFDSVAASYRAHEKTALALKKSIWRKHHKELPDMQSALREKGFQQKRILQDVQRGKIKPQKANELNRSLAEELPELQKAVHISQAIVNAQSPEDLGGLIELPIDEYAPRIDPDYAKRSLDAESPQAPIDPVLLRKAVAAIICIAIVWAGWTYYASLGKASFSAAQATGRLDTIEISCKNNGEERIKIYAPWPDGTTTASERERFPRRSFGIQLYVKERGSDAFRLLPSSPGCWSRGRNLVAEGTAVSIPANRIRNIEFDPAGLKELGIEASAVRLVVTRHGGREMLQFEAKVN